MQCKNVCSLNVDERTWTWANRWTKGVNRKHHMSVVRPFSQLNSSLGDDQMLQWIEHERGLWPSGL